MVKLFFLSFSRSMYHPTVGHLEGASTLRYWHNMGEKYKQQSMSEGQGGERKGRGGGGGGGDSRF